MTSTKVFVAEFYKIAKLIIMNKTHRSDQSNNLSVKELHEEYRGILDEMQTPGQKAAAERAFNATPEDLGRAAAAAAQQKIKTAR